MKKCYITLISLLIPALFFPKHLHAWKPKVGDLFHITGCENGELLVPVVNLWSKPGGAITGAKIVGKLSGDGRKDQDLKCQGSVVRVLKFKKDSGRTFLKVYSVVNSKVGWITDSFIGRKFDKRKCESYFKNKNHIRNCIGE